MEYILARYTGGGLKPAADSPLFPEYLQWFHYCEGMINTIVVQTILLPPERQNKEALEQAMRLLARALAPIDEALAGRDYLIGDFSAYIGRIDARPAFQKAMNG
ncbi:MAG: hypothetical protein VCE43_02675 [Myxococcota bacterium]|nr:hypothetical protein [Planctomycetota bacterium]